MTELIFCRGTGEVSKAVRDTAERIARRHGALFVTERSSGRWRYWFVTSGTVQGNRDTARDVIADLQWAGLNPDKLGSR